MVPRTFACSPHDSWPEQQRQPRRRRISRPDRGSGPAESVRPDPGLPGRGHHRPGEGQLPRRPGGGGFGVPDQALHESTASPGHPESPGRPAPSRRHLPAEGGGSRLPACPPTGGEEPGPAHPPAPPAPPRAQAPPAPPPAPPPAEKNLDQLITESLRRRSVSKPR